MTHALIEWNKEAARIGKPSNNNQLVFSGVGGHVERKNLAEMHWGQYRISEMVLN